MTLAHAGHWIVQVAYFLPVVGFLGWLGWTTLKDRRAGRRDGEDSEGANSVE